MALTRGGDTRTLWGAGVTSSTTSKSSGTGIAFIRERLSMPYHPHERAPGFEVGGPAESSNGYSGYHRVARATSRAKEVFQGGRPG